MKQKLIFTSLLFLSILLLESNRQTFAQGKDKPSVNILAKTLATQYTKMNINNISTFIYNDGDADQTNIGGSGLQYPIGSGHTLIYDSGLLWVGTVDGQIRSGGSCYNSGLTPGKILSNGSPENSTSSSVRAYRVRPDYKTSDLSSEISDENKTYQTIFNQYELDWNEWPANSGAPFKDVNNNGIYEPSIDIPGVPEADQTIWFVANDLDSIQTKKLFGALPMGIEIQTTVWAYKNVDPLNNIIFKRYLIINKSNKKFENMYLGIWSDPDLGGDSGDDLVGCDTLLNMDFCYNGDDNSDPSFGLYVPSVGFVLLQGPTVSGSPTDTAKFMGKKIYSKKNLPMTSFGWYGKGQAINHDPTLGSYEKGTLQLYNLIQGKNNDGTSITDPFTGSVTKFPFSGDPVTGKGFLGGVTYSNGFSDYKYDHRMMLNIGTFNMAPGDTQEVIFAELAAGGDDGVSRLAAVTLLKQEAKFAQLFYKNNFNPPSATKAISNLQAAEMDREIILTWGDDVNEINRIENSNSSFYSFQGYNVYQISKNATTLGQKKRIATFDIVDGKLYIYDEGVIPSLGIINQEVKQYGTDSGIQRFISIKKDYWRDVPLNNGSDYDFGVSYYNVTNDLNYPFTSYESAVTAVTVKPQSSKPGVSYKSNFGDVITANHISGSSIAEVQAVIIDPTKVTGNNYEIFFNSVNNKLTFSLNNISKNKTVLSSQTNLSGDNDYIITDGFIVKVKNNSNNPLTIKDVYRFTAPKVVTDKELTSDDLEKINVFPNPYSNVYSNEYSKYDRHLTFSHLPQRAIIRIFNLAGQLVRKLEKDSPDQFYIWNMLNENNYQIPSGLYIAHIELPDFGKVKILKFAIVTSVFIPDHF